MPRYTAISSVILLLVASIFSGAAKASVSRRAQKGGVALRIEIPRRSIKLSESLFVRLSLRNVARSGEMVVADWKYRGGEELYRHWIQASEGLGLDYIELIGPDGSRVEPGWYEAFGPAAKGPADVAISSPDAETSSRAAVLRGQGLSPDEITRRLNEWSRQREEADREARFPAHFLAPGKTARTASFCAGPGLCPGNGFAQLPFKFEKAGRYKVRAVYDHAPSSGPADSWDVSFATPWIEFEVAK